MLVTELYMLDGTTPVPAPDLDTWAQWRRTADRHVAETWVTPAVRVSTVFLMMDHRWGDGPPLLFETLVFGGESDGEMWRYSTWDEAHNGHTAVVAAVRLLLETTA